MNEPVSHEKISELQELLEMLDSMNPVELSTFNQNLDEMRQLMLSVDIDKYSLNADDFLQRIALTDPIWRNHCLENEDSISDSKFISKFLNSPAHQERGFSIHH